MSALTAWYQNQYSAWSRTHRLQMPPFLARPDTTISRTATATATVAARPENDIVIDMAELGQDPDSKNKDTLFGPSIGIINNGPKWAQSKKSKAAPGDELTSDIVRSWVMKSKEASHPTTTLQALVNLKRPTIRLSPLAANASSTELDKATTHHLQHGLEFEFDCDAPKCRISIHVIGVRLSEDEAGATSSDLSQNNVVIFETKMTGGFGRKLKLQDGAMLDLMKLEEAGRAGTEAEHHQQTVSHEEPDQSPAAAAPSAPSSSDTSPPPSAANGRKKRLTFFRKRDHSTHNRAAAGPALAVVDAEANASANNATPAAGADGQPEAEKHENDDAEAGVKVVIKLAALDETGEPLRSPNEQTTYLHVVRMGEVPAHAEGEEEAEEDMRPWVVKVVKREATIGAHTFHLHEIYGLSAHSHAPACPLPAPGEHKHEHTYPPASPPIINTAASPSAQTDDDSPSECLVCLSSAREVVLLPCRHLVACRECAVNMIEFGAGGQLVHAEEPTNATQETPATPTAATGATDGSNNEDGDQTNTTPVTPTVPAAPTHRRRRKAKGWFCPVCRQPYTAMLRITTSPPPMPKGTEVEVDKEKRDSMASGSSHDEPAVTAASADPLGATAAPAEDSGSQGGFMHQISLRSLRGNNTTAADATLPPDLERQA